VGGVFSATIGGIVNNIIGILLGIIVGALAFMIIIVAVIWALFKIWLALIKAYIFTLADIIFAPFLDFGRFNSRIDNWFWWLVKRYAFKLIRISGNHCYVPPC